MQLDVKIGQRIKVAREAVTLSVDEFADMMRIEVSTLRGIEDGTIRPSAELFFYIAEKLGAPISYFFSNEGQS